MFMSTQQLASHGTVMTAWARDSWVTSDLSSAELLAI